MTSFNKYNINSGNGLQEFIMASGLKIKTSSGLEGVNNSIKLPDITAFNWKIEENAVRVNCKENAMKVIEKYTELKHFDNGKGDPSRPYSFFVYSFSDLVDVVYALKTIEGNKNISL